jgi:hypothetical protein
MVPLVFIAASLITFSNAMLNSKQANASPCQTPFLVPHSHLPIMACHSFLPFTSQCWHSSWTSQPFKVKALHSSKSQEPLMHLHNTTFQKTRILIISGVETFNFTLLPLSTLPIINREVNSFLTENNFTDLKTYPTYPVPKQTYCNHGNRCLTYS